MRATAIFESNYAGKQTVTFSSSLSFFFQAECVIGNTSRGITNKRDFDAQLRITGTYSNFDVTRSEEVTRV